MFLLIATGEIGGAPLLPAFFRLIHCESALKLFGYAQWEGLNITYIAMPLFLFVSGLTVPFSLGKRISENQADKKIYLHIIKRLLVLYLLGLIAGGHLLQLDLNKLQIYNNVLEYIGVGYLVCSVLVLNTTVTVQLAWVVSLLFLHWALLSFVPVPGWEGEHFLREMNLAVYIDNIILGPFHRPGSWQVLGTVNFVSNMLIGVLVGQMLKGSRDRKDKAILLFACGMAMLSSGFIWSPFCPVIRNLWTSSYVLVTCGISTLLLALFYLVIDVRGYAKWSFFFLVFGVNSIAVYMMAHMFDFKLIGNIFVGGLRRFLEPGVQGFVEATAAMTVIWLILYWMYCKKTFIKV